MSPPEIEAQAERLVDRYYNLPEDDPQRDTVWDTIEHLERAYGGRFRSVKLREFLDAAPVSGCAELDFLS